MPLAFVPRDLGAWTVCSGLHGLLRGEHAREASAGGETEIYGILRLSVEF